MNRSHVSESADYEQCVVMNNWNASQETIILKMWKV